MCLAGTTFKTHTAPQSDDCYSTLLDAVKHMFAIKLLSILHCLQLNQIRLGICGFCLAWSDVWQTALSYIGFTHPVIVMTASAHLLQHNGIMSTRVPVNTRQAAPC